MRISVLVVAALILASVVTMGWTGALFSADAPPQSSSLTAGSQASLPAPAATCHAVANLSFDPYLRIETRPATAGGPPAKFEPLLASARALLPDGATLAAGTAGIGGSTTGITGSPSAPVSAAAFAAGYCDETELSQFDPAATPACPTTGATYSSAEQYDLCALDPSESEAIPSGAVAESAPSGYSATGVGLPYVAVYALAQVTSGADGEIEFSGSPLLSGVPVSVLYPDYTPLPSAFGPDQPASGGGGGFHAVVSFSLAGYVAASGATSGPLLPATTYVAYLLVQDTDPSGPLADHLWYFVP
jgi:hypothetical protein